MWEFLAYCSTLLKPQLGRGKQAAFEHRQQGSFFPSLDGFIGFK
jgi:hypothetical protein